MIMSEALFAIWVPVIPIEKPTSAFIKAGASFVPSPVTATTLFSFWMHWTNLYLCSGLERAKTFKFFKKFSISWGGWSGDNFYIYLPSMTKPGRFWPGSVIPTWSAMALAVNLLSPVTMITTTPPLWQLLMAILLYYLGKSWIPMSIWRINPLFSMFKTPPLLSFFFDEIIEDWDLADVCIWSLTFMLGNSEKSLTYL